MLGGIVVAISLVVTGVNRYYPVTPRATVNRSTVTHFHRYQAVMEPTRLIQDAKPSLALIETSPSLMRAGEALGSGFLVAKGIVATNAHVIENTVDSEIRVSLPSCEGVEGHLPASIVYADEERDLALLSIRHPHLPPPLRLSETSTKPGEDLLALGNTRIADVVLSTMPLPGTAGSLTQWDGQEYLHIAAGARPGNSGGPALNAKGEVVGVVTAVAEPNITLCVPVAYLRQAIESLRGSVPGALLIKSKHRARRVADRLLVEAELLNAECLRRTGETPVLDWFFRSSSQPYLDLRDLKDELPQLNDPVRRQLVDSAVSDPNLPPLTRDALYELDKSVTALGSIASGSAGEHERHNRTRLILTIDRLAKELDDHLDDRLTSDQLLDSLD